MYNKFLSFGWKALVIMALAFIVAMPVSAATTDFVANGNVIVTGVTFGSSTVDMLIMNGSKAESWTFNSGTFTVTNPDATNTFKVGSADSNVIAIEVKLSGIQVTCTNNTAPGTGYAVLPSSSGIYTIYPLSSLCSTSSSGGGGSSYVAPTPTPTPEPEPEQTPAETPSNNEERANQVQVIAEEAVKVLTKAANEIAEEVGLKRNLGLEQRYNSTIVARVVVANTPAATRAQVTNFVTYGTSTTTALGAGERAGVVNSFREAFGKVPESEADWQDVIKIANGRWPSTLNAEREKAVAATFKKIYLREAVRTNAHDDAAMTIMAYGLRSANRNMNSEKVAINSFKAVFGKAPSTASDWDAVRAIAYSGATR